MPKKLDGENEGGGDLRGVQRTLECAAATTPGRETTSLGGGRVESVAERKISEADGDPTKSTIGRACGTSFSPPVVAVRLDRLRA